MSLSRPPHRQRNR